MASPAKFAQRLAAIAQGVELNSGNAVRDAAAAAIVALVRLTPVGGFPTSPRDRHPGLARSNWQVLPGDQSAVVARPETSEAEAITAGLAAARELGGPDATVSISNVVSYINRLNEGQSDQAPAGFVEAAIAEASATVKNVRLLKRLPPRVIHR